MRKPTENIETSIPVIENRLKLTHEIARFWDKTSEAVRTIWGPHIHHGYFETNRETPLEAQEKLIEKLTALIKISAHDKILDAGCGMGGSSLYLAKKYQAEVTGITLSQKQMEIAAQSARKEGVKNVSFKVEDALSMASFPDNTFDVVWSLESCEQFYDKSLFIRQAFRVLKPGGQLMLATWCSGADKYEGIQARIYRKFCVIWQVPYMPTINHYTKLLQQQGFTVGQVLNWSSHVVKTWEIGLENLRSYPLFKIFRMSGWRGLVFRKQVKIMQAGFDQQMVEYGVFSAGKPS